MDALANVSQSCTAWSCKPPFPSERGERKKKREKKKKEEKKEKRLVE